MIIAKIENNKVVDIGEPSKVFPNTSFTTNGPDVDFMEANGCLWVTLKKPYDPLTQKLVAVDPYIEETTVYIVVVESLTVEEIASNTELQWAKVRKQRDDLLASCDWTQLPDVSIPNKANWATYRQSLRDITGQPDPYSIIWPNNPNEVIV